MTILFVFLFLLLVACGVDTNPPEPSESTPDLIIRDSWVFEQEGKSTMQFEVIPIGAVEQPIGINFSVTGLTADPVTDFTAGEGATTLGIGASSIIIPVTILDDDLNEVDEKILVTITNATNANITDAIAIGIIRDDDDATAFDEEGYFTNTSYYGYELVWQDEFEGTGLNLDDYNFDLENGCPDICGWGNNELEWYTDEPKNVFLDDGKLVIKATQEGATSYHSGRIHTKGKQAFQFGRIDVRAKLPKGQGIWPAIWMLGSNIDEVGWPACGEIDIMELVGHRPNVVHGTAHWGAQGSGRSIFKTSEFALDEDFHEKFHVFTIIWEKDEIVWYVDESPFHIISPADMQGGAYRFNEPFYFLFNVAVGGNFSGFPDETTVFPQQMEIDYVRVFQ